MNEMTLSVVVVLVNRAFDLLDLALRGGTTTPEQDLAAEKALKDVLSQAAALYKARTGKELVL